MDHDAHGASRVAPGAGAVDPTDASASAAIGPSVYRWNLGRYIAAVVLLVGAALTPWNLYFGVGIPGSSRAWFAVLLTVTALAFGSIAAPHTRRPSLRITLCAPYALFIVAVVFFDLFETLKYGDNPGAPGVGPGVWLGAAGAVLASQPVLTGIPQTDIDQRRPWLAAARLVGAASVVLAALAVGFTLYWQTSQAIPGMGQAGLFGRSVATIATATVYDAAALAPVIVGSSWILRRNKASRLAIIALGLSTLAAGLLVWITQIGRDIDVYHGIAQITSLTPAVGFEGYLAWAAAAAIFAPLTLRAVMNQQSFDASAWRQACRKGLLLVAVGCAGAAAMRFADLVVSVSFDIRHPIFDGVVLIVINLATAGLAWWLRGNYAAQSGAPSVFPAACAILLLLSISRVVAALVLTPRQPGLAAAAAAQPVYGNALSQQLTSTFDVVLCFLALGIVVAALIVARTETPQSGPDVFGGARASLQHPNPGAQHVADPAVSPAVATSSAVLSTSAKTGESATPSNDSGAPVGKRGVDAVLQASTQRFGAGTTYTGRGDSTRDGQGDGS